MMKKLVTLERKSGRSDQAWGDVDSDRDAAANGATENINNNDGDDGFGETGSNDDGFDGMTLAGSR